MNCAREFNNMMEYCEKQLNRGRITIAEYRELEDIAIRVFKYREVTTTISEKVKEIAQEHGIYNEESGIGWKMVALPFTKKSRNQWYKGVRA